MIDTNFQKTISTKDNRTIMLRPPKIDDVHTIHEFYNKTVQENTFTLFPRTLNITEATDYVNNIVKLSTFGNGFYIGAFDQDKYIGSVSINYQGFRERHVAKLGIVLEQEYRGIGIGKQIISIALELCQQQPTIKMVILDCFSTNERALKLYNDLGFTEIGRYPKAVYYKDEYVDKVFMYKPLKD